MKDKAQQFWDKHAGHFDENEKKSDPIYEDIIAKTSKYLDPNDNILDFGCATGTKTIELAGRVKHIHGLDFSPEMIRLANKKKDELNIPNISFSRGTIYSKELEPASFDKIISYSVIHLLEDKEEVIHRISELLKPGGLFISLTACFKEDMALKDRLKFISYRIRNKLGLFPLHLNMFKSSDVEKLISDQDFKIIDDEKMSSWINFYFVVAEKGIVKSEE